MLAVVKTPRIELSLSGALENVTALLNHLRKKYEVDVVTYSPELEPEEDRELIDVFKSELWADAYPGSIAAGARLKHDLTQKQLAELTGIKQENISAYETGKRPLTRKAAEKIGAALGENPEKFFRNCSNANRPGLKKRRKSRA